MNQLRGKREKILCGVAFCFFVLVATYKLTNAPLWFDETIEYWYSKVMVGRLPFDVGAASGSLSMYQRIISTYQPPLYNVLMFFWLKIGDSEWWFRFFGVVMGFVGMVAAYKTVYKIGNAYLAALAVVFSTCIYRLVYYWQECAEYCLMLGTLFWTIYFWICLIENSGKKEIICFTISAVIPVYSQYGAVFPVVVMGLSACACVVMRKNREQIITMVISDIIALIVTALPLYFFFLRKQMLNQQGGEITFQNISFTGGIFRDAVNNFTVVFKWNFLSYYSDVTTKIFVVIFFLLVIFVIVFSHNKKIKLFIGINIAAWILYYFCVKIGMYAYGGFGSRYNLFFIPMWLIMCFAMGIEIYSILSRCNLKNMEIEWYYTGICLCFILCFSYFAWESKLKNNWEKENCRDAVSEWYSVDANNSNTIVYYGATSGFAYYVRHNDKYTDRTEANVNYMYWYRDRSIDEYREYVNSVYGNIWPDEIYIVASHTRDDMNVFVSSITNMGYEREDVYSQDAYLIRLTKTVDSDGSAR